MYKIMQQGESHTLCGYYFNIPINQWELYLKHIIVGIYGIKNSNYTVVHEHNGVKRVEIKTNPQIPLINSLPMTLHKNQQAIYYTGENLVNIVSSIKDAISDFFTPGGIYHNDSKLIQLNSEELEPIIKQLASDYVINRYAQLDDNKFIIHIEPYPVTILLKVLCGSLIINIFSETIISPFDVDDGYTGVLTCLNPMWKKWRTTGDITAPIQPPNYV